MTNTYALTDYDVYDDEDYDNFRGRRRRRRKARRRKRIIAKRRKYTKPIMGRPPIRSIPRYIKKRSRVIKGRPMKLPRTKVKGLPVIPLKKGKPAIIKTKKPPIVKTKTPIDHLIKKSQVKEVRKPLSKVGKTEVKQLETTQKKALKKAMASYNKTSKVVKVIAIVGVVGITGFGIYKFIQNKKQNDGHISTSK
ncbi:MAG: hypothetical protein ABNH00_11680 [Dokdonia sp.]|jgi:hypothetical protein